MRATCRVDDCDRFVAGWGLCDAHYRRWKAGKPLGGRIIQPKRSPCTIQGCEGLQVARGYCSPHYDKWRRRGTATPPPRYKKCVRQKCHNEMTVGVDLCATHLNSLGRRKSKRPCSVTGCDGTSLAKGMCEAHYARSRRGIPLDAPMIRNSGIDRCTRPGCDRPYATKGYCTLHYERVKYGRDLDAPIREPWANPICRHPNCERVRDGSGGFCKTHYDRFRHKRDMDAPMRVRYQSDICSVDGCEDQRDSLGYCTRHYVTITGLGRRHSRRYKDRKLSGAVQFDSELWWVKIEYWGSRCWVCGTEHPADKLEQDHVKPVSKGGLHVLANLRPACRSCNATKNAKWPLPKLEHSTFHLGLDRAGSPHCHLGGGLPGGRVAV